MEKKITFKDVWKHPFKSDGWGYIWDADNIMVFSFEDDVDEEFQKDFTNLLNDQPGEKINAPLEIKDGCDLYMYNEVYVGSFRGWGHLIGGLRLSEEEAAKIQDDFIEWCLTKIKE